MTAPVAPMEARCAVCLDTGSTEKQVDGYQDCTHCDATTRRRALIDTAVKENWGHHLALKDALWAAYLFAQRQATPVAQPAQQAKTWVCAYCGGRTGEACNAGGCFANEASEPSAQQAGDVALKAARYDWLRTQSVGQWEHPIVVEQMRNLSVDRMTYIGPLSGGALDDAIDKAIAQGRKA